MSRPRLNKPRLNKPRPKWQYSVIGIAAAGAAVFGLVHTSSAAPTASSASAKKKPGATQRIKQNPPPQLFTDAAVADVSKQLGAQQKTADGLFAQWKKDHGSTRDDRAFTAWVEKTVPAPPSKTRRTAELHQVQELAKTRTAEGKRAATWLELHGKKDIWKLYLHDQRELIPRNEGTAEKAELKTALKLSKKITEQLAARYKQPAPYVLDPSLRPEKHVKPGQQGPFSYPSRHAAKSGAAATYLSALAPHRAEEYRWMAAQIAYSRVYMAGHMPSDILAGALVGDLVGDYVLTTNGHTPPR
ncbi:phosphatase PAP2 family protein [Streptomyces sp. NPDC046862]|uniref:phosphatase PAP2 family protein n=1 Tax=Streptomyces sp. NPDC046862 TaxID=3154603 RepID=UPI00345122FD